jgi:hypothetical protein
MAYKWSWAFGPESVADLENYTGWDFDQLSTSYSNTTNVIKHTWLGDQTDKYSVGLRDGYYLRSDPSWFAGEGWISIYFYVAGSSTWTSDANILIVDGPNSVRGIHIRATSGKGFTLQLGNLGTKFTGSISGLTNDTWHHLGFKYNMTTEDTWTGQLYINGVADVSGSTTNTYLDAETNAQLILGGMYNSAPSTGYGIWYSDILSYDSQTDPNPYGQLVSRIKVFNDVAESGSWSPASNSGASPGPQASNLSGAVDTTPVVAEATPTTGEFVRIKSKDIGTNLGLTSFNSYGFTSHNFASGSSATNIIPKFQLDSGVYVTGSSVIDGTNAYAYASSGSSAYTSGSIITYELQVSGS